MQAIEVEDPVEAEDGEAYKRVGHQTCNCPQSGDVPRDSHRMQTRPEVCAPVHPKRVMNGPPTKPPSTRAPPSSDMGDPARRRIDTFVVRASRRRMATGGPATGRQVRRPPGKLG
jgi:hypothetical protein